MSECDTCTRPTVDTGYCCHDCTQRLDKALAFVAECSGELDTVITRQSKGAPAVGGRSAESPLPFNATAAEAGWSVWNTFVAWCRDIIERRGLSKPDDDSLDAMAVWLRANLAWLRCQPIAAEAFDELTYACWLFKAAIDSKPDLVYVGPCGAATEDGQCEHDLRAAKGNETVTCPACGTRYDTAGRTRWLLKLVHDRLDTAPVISAVVTAWGRRLPVDTIRSWAHRRRLTRKTTDPVTGQPLYRLGDVLELAERIPVKEQV